MMSTGGGSQISGRYRSSASKPAPDSASKLQVGRQKSTAINQYKSGNTPLKAKNASTTGFQDSSTKLYSPYQVNNICKDYAPIVKRRPESNIKQRSKKELTFNALEWQSQHSKSSSKHEFREILLSEETNGHPVGQEREVDNPRKGTSKPLITQSEQKAAVRQQQDLETPSHAYFNQHMDSPQVQSMMLRGGKLPHQSENWTSQV